MTTQPPGRTRSPLTRQRVLAEAVDLADGEGVESLTMRRLAQRLGVEPMSLYHHVANKAALLDGVVEVVVEEILAEVTRLEAAAPLDEWRAALRRRVLAARAVLLRHPWAPALVVRSEHVGPGVARYFDGVLGILLAGGFSYDLAHHALHALGSRALGFSQELFQPGDAGEDTSAEVMEAMAAELPHLVGMMAAIAHDDGSTLGWCDDQAEFEFGIDVLLDGLDSARRAQAPHATPNA